MKFTNNFKGWISLLTQAHVGKSMHNLLLLILNYKRKKLSDIKNYNHYE